MRFLHLTLLYCLLNVFSTNPALEFPPSSPVKIAKSITAKPSTTKEVAPRAINLIFQSKDGGQTWEDISSSLPENGQPEDLFAGESEVYLRVKDGMYRSNSNLQTPVWEKENVPGPRSASIAFNRSGVMAYNFEGQIYQKTPAAGPDSYRDWLPVYTNFEKHWMRSIFETADGTVFLGADKGLYKSADKGQNWKQVQNEGWIMNMVESNGVLIATGQKGIMRSTDNGEHWEWVISEGGVGIAIERIEGGFAAITYSTITKTRRMRISMDSGKTWEAIDTGLQPSLFISSIKQKGRYLLCGHHDGIYRSSDRGKTWSMVHPRIYNPLNMSFNTWSFVDPGVNQNVFRLYVSGNVVYAVAGGGGC
ncbi:MAG TPA: exo-alpha-sialidase [Cyclobacteriaceae bacterium]